MSTQMIELVTDRCSCPPDIEKCENCNMCLSCEFPHYCAYCDDCAWKCLCWDDEA